ncbi:MAG: ATP-binding protein [Ignisphaera sp.]
MRYAFVNRLRELQIIERAVSGDGLKLIAVYGRRRIGKTHLLRYFCSNRNCFYFVAIEASKHILYRELAKALSIWIGKPVGFFDNIDDFLDFMVKEVGKGFIIVFDEFQYIVDSDPESISRLQRFCDNNKDLDIAIVLCGSSVSFFEKKLLGYSSPLFGRRTVSLKLKPMGFIDAWNFYPNYNPLESIYIYSAFGGTPAYLALIDESRDVFSNISEKILYRGSYLFDEALNFFRQEVREPSTYIAILSAIANGYTKPGEIASVAGVTSKSISRYLDVLEHLDIVERIKPLGRRGGEVHIEIVDPYFSFWFRYVRPNMTRLELGYVDEVLEDVKSTYDIYVSKVIESVFRREIVYVFLKELDIDVGEVGRWWYKSEEIDTVARGRDTSVFIEIKWSRIDFREALSIARDLESKASLTGLQKPRNIYIVIAREIEKCRPMCREHHYIAIDMLDMLYIIRKKLLKPNKYINTQQNRV